jgi:hypothetical protein
MRLRTKVLLVGAMSVLAVALSAAPALASTALSSGTWTSFNWSGGDGAVPFGSPFTFTNAAPVVVTVTDVLCVGDRFTLTDTALLGTTSLPGIAPTCAYSGSTANPDTALADPTYSHGLFAVAPGSHAIGIVVSTSPFGSGTAFIRVDPMNKGMCKNDSWKGFGGANTQFKNQGDCVSFVATVGKNLAG